MGGEPNMEDVLTALVKHTKNPSALLEVYYWSQEDGMAEFLRCVLALPQETRDALMRFVMISGDRRSMRLEKDGLGRITLISPGIEAVLSKVARAHSSV